MSETLDWRHLCRTQTEVLVRLRNALEDIIYDRGNAKMIAREALMGPDAAYAMPVRIDRAIRECLHGDYPKDGEPIMFRFTTLEEFQKFIEKVLVVGNVKS